MPLCLSKILNSQKLGHGGTTRAYNPVFLTVIGIHNLIDQIIEGQSVVERWYYTVPFLLIAIIIYFIPKQKIILSYALLVFAVISHIDAVDPNGFNSAIIFLMAYINNKKKHIAVLVIFLSFTSITYKYGTTSGTPSDAVLLMILYAYFFYSFYKEVILHIIMPFNIKLKQLSDDENKLLQLMCAGYSQQQAGKEIGHPHKQATNKMMNSIREKLDIDKSESTYKITSIYTKYGK